MAETHGVENCDACVENWIGKNLRNWRVIDDQKVKSSLNDNFIFAIFYSNF